MHYVKMYEHNMHDLHYMQETMLEYMQNSMHIYVYMAKIMYNNMYDMQNMQIHMQNNVQREYAEQYVECKTCLLNIMQENMLKYVQYAKQMAKYAK